MMMASPSSDETPLRKKFQSAGMKIIVTKKSEKYRLEIFYELCIFKF
jgi:hypothetical protein